MVKVLAIEGNRIKLSRKALIKEQRASWTNRLRRRLNLKRWKFPPPNLLPLLSRPSGPAMSSTSVSPSRTRAPF